MILRTYKTIKSVHKSLFKSAIYERVKIRLFNLEYGSGREVKEETRMVWWQIMDMWKRMIHPSWDILKPQDLKNPTRRIPFEK